MVDYDYDDRDSDLAYYTSACKQLVSLCRHLITLEQKHSKILMTITALQIKEFPTIKIISYTNKKKWFRNM